MRDNIILLFVIVIFAIGYFRFTSKINKDQFNNQGNLLNLNSYKYVFGDKIQNTINGISKSINQVFM